MSKERLTAFTDAVLAIAMTILVLELKQPAHATWAAIWALRQSFLAYLISFFGLMVMWNNQHHIFQLVRKIDGHVLWANRLMLFSASFFPYATKFVDEHFFDTTAETFYGIVFLVLSIGYFAVDWTLIKADPENHKLRYAVMRPGKIIADFGTKIVGLLVGLWFPPAVIFSTFVAMMIWFVPEHRVEEELNQEHHQS
ncbi:MAG TPA: hypothetical protein DCW31_05455 [Lactobacillus sp.]|nr:hypothetical protein [Lactobacillus sp.]